MATLAVTTSHKEFQPFIDAAVFTVTEVHAAQRITDAVFSSSKSKPTFLDYLSVAIAVWAPVNGHVCADLSNVQQQVKDEIGSSNENIDPLLQAQLEWPSLSTWSSHLSASPLVSIPLPDKLDDVDYTKPLVLFGNLLYLTRQWAD